MSVSAVNSTPAVSAASRSASQSSSSAPASFDALVASLKGTSSASAQANGSASTDEGEDRFLKLLVAQMNNQDPLSPMDNAQVTSQLAQINTVKGIDKLNATVQKLLEQSQGGAADAASLVGRRVLVEGDQMQVQDGVAAKAGFQLASPADSVRIEVLDAKGKVVDSSVRNTVPAGLNVLEWHGAQKGTRLPAGDYSLRISASNGKTPVTATPLTAATVNAVVPGSAGNTLNVGALGSRTMADIRGYL